MLLAVAAALAPAAAADITAVYAMAGGEQLRVEYRDAANFRIGTDSRNYQLMLDGRLYAAAQGQVIDVDKMSRQIKAVGGDLSRRCAGQRHCRRADRRQHAPAFGRKETVAGQTGEVVTGGGPHRQR